MAFRFLLFALLSLSVAFPTGASDITPPLPNVGPPLLLRLDGVIVPSKDAARGVGFAAVSFGFLGVEESGPHWLAVTDARTVGGDHPLLGKDVLDILAPFTPNLYIPGPPELAQRLRELAPGTPVRLEGLVDRGSRTYLLRQVEVRQPAGGTSSASPGRTA
jgi:hypothetical protein